MPLPAPLQVLGLAEGMLHPGSITSSAWQGRGKRRREQSRGTMPASPCCHLLPPPASPPSHPAASQKANVSTHPSSQGDGNVEAIALGKAATVSQKQLFGLSATQAPQHSCLPSPALTPSHPNPQQPPGPHYVGTPPSQWDDTQHSLSSPSGMLREGEHLHPTQPTVGTPHHHFMAQGVGCSCAAQPAPHPPQTSLQMRPFRTSKQIPDCFPTSSSPACHMAARPRKHPKQGHSHVPGAFLHPWVAPIGGTCARHSMSPI